MGQINLFINILTIIKLLVWFIKFIYCICCGKTMRFKGN